MVARGARLAAGVLLCATALAGCFNFDVGRRYPERRAYQLNVARDGSPHEAPRFPAVEIRRFRVSPAYAGRGFVYRTRDGSFESDFYNEFFVAPGAMIQQQTAAWLTASGLFEAVVESGSRAPIGLQVEGNVVAIYGDYSGPGAPEAVLELQFLLSGPEGRTAQRNYSERVRAQGDDANGLVAAWNDALKRVFTNLEQDLMEGPGIAGRTDPPLSQ